MALLAAFTGSAFAEFDGFLLLLEWFFLERVDGFGAAAFLVGIFDNKHDRFLAFELGSISALPLAACQLGLIPFLQLAFLSLFQLAPAPALELRAALVAFPFQLDLATVFLSVHVIGYVLLILGMFVRSWGGLLSALFRFFPKLPIFCKDFSDEKHFSGYFLHLHSKASLEEIPQKIGD